MVLPPEIAILITSQIRPELQTMGGLLPIRQQLVLLFEDEKPPEFHRSRILMTPIAVFTKENFSSGIDVVEDLRVSFNNETEFSESILENVNLEEATGDLDFPSDPFIFVTRRLLVVALHFVDMENGRGVAFITM